MYTLADKAQAMGAYERGMVKVIYEDMAGGYNNILKVCPIVDVDTTEGVDLTMEDEGPALAGYDSRAINGVYPESTGGLKQRGWVLGNIGGRVTVDNVFLRQKGYAAGANPMDLNMMQLARRINRRVNEGIVTGDRAVNPFFINGFGKYLPADNIVDVSSFGAFTASGLNVTNTAGASLAANQRALVEAVDNLLDVVGGRGDPDVYLVANYQVQMMIRKAIKEQGWFGTNISTYDKTVNEFGGVKFLTPGARYSVKTFAKAVDDNGSIIPNNFSYGSAPTGKNTEIYAVRFNATNGFHLKQLSGGMKTRDIGLLEAAPIYAKEMEWWLGGYCPRDDAVAKLIGVQAKA